MTRGLAATLEQARALIMAGQVSADGRRLEKAGMMVDPDLAVHVKAQARYVSRAGDKMASVAGELGLDFAGKTVLDVGSSTGGFTDFALQNGATRVFGVDVGTAQLAYKLRHDSRVVVMEQTDIRDVRLGRGDGPRLPEAADMAVMDVSFISLREVLEPTVALLAPGGLIVAMAKPQFEADKATADEYRGVIPVGEVRDEIVAELRAWCFERFDIVSEADSGVAGDRGNVERFFVLRARV